MFATRTLARLAVLAVSVFVATSASADPLIDVFDGTSYLSSWQGQTTFSDGGTLTGYVNWMVYDGGTFPYAGYTPSDSSEYTYVFQIFSTGTDDIHYFSTELDSKADSIGALAAPAVSTEKAAPGGVAPSGTSLQQWYATWEFTDHDIGPNEHSQLLVFSSSSLPSYVVGDIQDGSDVEVDPVPGPGSGAVIITIVPEPATLSLTLVGLGVMAAGWIVQRWQRTKSR